MVVRRFIISLVGVVTAFFITIRKFKADPNVTAATAAAQQQYHSFFPSSQQSSFAHSLPADGYVTPPKPVAAMQTSSTQQSVPSAQQSSQVQMPQAFAAMQTSQVQKEFVPVVAQQQEQVQAPAPVQTFIDTSVPRAPPTLAQQAMVDHHQKKIAILREEQRQLEEQIHLQKQKVVQQQSQQVEQQKEKEQPIRTIPNSVQPLMLALGSLSSISTNHATVTDPNACLPTCYAESFHSVIDFVCKTYYAGCSLQKCSQGNVNGYVCTKSNGSENGNNSNENEQRPTPTATPKARPCSADFSPVCCRIGTRVAPVINYCICQQMGGSFVNPGVQCAS